MRINYDIIEELLPDNMLGIDLYHYTSADGLIGIFNRNEIRCTQIFYVNDIEENLNGWKVFFNVFDSYKNEHKNLIHFKEKIQQLFINWRKIKFDDLSSEVFQEIDISGYRSFIFSLSQVEDDLNQWRSYTSESFGFSIHFNFSNDFWKQQSIFKDLSISKIENINNCKILLRKCVYETKEKINIMTRLLDFYFTKFIERKHNWALELYFNILTLCLFFKNENFKAEKECRIVVLPTSDKIRIKDKEIDIIKIRKGKNFLVPYIELDVIPSCIKGITIGPTPFKYHSKESLKIMIKNLPDFNDKIIIKNTRIPFRSW